ncbi:unnamed protein product [Sphagnum troendelagicum]|uniref:Uncharacterized protein n=1 Tax=Sphagnum troendelagicum TaxID=128251 RepID=A0ABP0TXA3_9BRYO
MQAIRGWAGGMMMYKKNDMREKERERGPFFTDPINQSSKQAGLQVLSRVCDFLPQKIILPSFLKNLELHISYFEILEMGSLLPGSWW